MKEVPLTKGYVAIVDDADFEAVSAVRWCAMTRPDGIVYAMRTVGARTRGNSKCLLMHRVLTSCPRGMVVDHLDGNGLNNTRANMRVCTQSENIRRRRLGKRRHADLPFGVYRLRPGEFFSQIDRLGVRHYVGYFTDAAEAARAYDRKVLELDGAMARLNYPEEYGLDPVINGVGATPGRLAMLEGAQ